VAEEGEPYAARGWGLDVVSADSSELRLLLYAADTRGRALFAPGRPIAITAGSVRTLESIQMKGTVVRVDDGTAADRARCDRYCDAFFRDVEEMDGTRRSLLNRMRPNDVFSVVVRVDERYDQTPGPGAGTVIT
jgi:hypothetical protein